MAAFGRNLPVRRDNIISTPGVVSKMWGAFHDRATLILGRPPPRVNRADKTVNGGSKITYRLENYSVALTDILDRSHPVTTGYRLFSPSSKSRRRLA
jgi:hypothetical protein